MAAIERYCAPTSLEEAAEILRGGNVTIVAGGTDLMVQTQIGKLQFKPTLMNIRRIAGMSGVRDEGETIRIGALTTMTELLDSALVRERLDILRQACDQFASDQLRNAATLGGNICNASPAGDTLVPLLVLNARVVLVSKPNGNIVRRAVPLAQFFAGPGRTNRLPAELLSEIELPAPPAGFHGTFFKFGTRPALDIATISIGLGAVRDGKALRDVRVAYGSVAPTPIRGPRTEAALEGRTLDTETIAVALRAAGGEVHPISDVRASDWYRSELICNTLRRMLSHVHQG
jgi:CO/xanthine dehydrogenase FAD-binding subunit